MVLELRHAVTARALRAMAVCTPWVEDEVRGLGRVVGAGDVVIDVGAALGVYTSVLSRLVGPAGRVMSVEPLPGLYATVDGWLRLRAPRNVHRYAVALGASASTATLSVPVRRGRPVAGRSVLTTGARGLGSNAEFAGQLEREVPVTTLDGLVDRAGPAQVDFVKVDVEGAELALFRGAERTIERFRPYVLAEVEDRHLRRYGHTADDVVSWFRTRGYDVSTWQEGMWRLVPNVAEGCRNYLFRGRR
ncbi:MAG: FkbM family methyltransferase [Streptosporangiales bacterium]